MPEQTSSMSFRRLCRRPARFRSAWSSGAAIAATLFACAILVCSAPVLAQGAGSGGQPTLSQRALQSETPDAFREEIETFLDFHLQRLFGEDPAAAQASREQLGAQVAMGEATTAFKNLYADFLISRLQRRSAGGSSFNQLNAAIVAEKIARATQTSRLAPLVTLLAQDDDAAVAMWGAKAAYPIFADLVRNLPAGDRDRLIAALVGAVKRFPDNGPLAEEVYDTLAMRTTEMRPAPAEVLQRGAPLVTPAVQELIALRVLLYRPNHAPPSPLAEGSGLVFLTNNFVWPSQTPEQRTRSVAVMRDLMLQAAATASGLPQNDEQRLQIIELLKRLGSALSGISGPNQPGGQPVYPEVYRAAQQLYRSTKSPSNAVLSGYVTELQGSLEAAFPGQPAPALSKLAATAPATQPATVPATGAATGGAPPGGN